MSEETLNQPKEPEEIRPEENAAAPQQPAPTAAQWRFFTRRNFFISFAALVALVFLLGLTGYFIFRFGYLDNYIKGQFVTKMDEIGIVFSADTFRTTVAPLSLELKNATFNDKITGEKLFKIDSAKIGLTVTDLYSWQLSRDFRVDSTDIDGMEAWVKFDENGNSNFSNLKFAQDEGRGYVNFNYTSLSFSLKNGLVHFGDVQRKIDADAKNVALTLAPENPNVPDEQKRYKFDLASTASTVVYDGRAIEPVDVQARGIAYREGAEITALKLTSPIAESDLSGNIEGWDKFRYNFNIDSSVDLTQAATLFPNGAALRGTGDFTGTVTGEGEKYQINGEITSREISAANVRLKGLQVNATITGENSIYEGNGKAIAEMLTFEDFRIDYAQLAGKIRGTGTDFRWVGELQAAAAKTPSGTLAGLFVSDAVAEYEDGKLSANLGSVAARRFSSPDADISNLRAGGIRISNSGNTTDVSAPNLRAGNIKLKGAELGGVTASGVRLRNRGSRTDLNAANLRAENFRTKDARLKNLAASGVNVTMQNGATSAQVKNVQAAQVDASGARVAGLAASNVTAQIRGSQTDVVAGNVRVARVETSAATLGSLNVAGVRLSIREGRIEGSSGDINAGNVALSKSAVPGGGTLEAVKIVKPVFVLEPSGRYRASLDLSLGGGVLGSVRLGAARASVVATSDEVALNNLTADVMDGKIDGNAVVALNNRRQSRVDADFADLDLAKLLALQGGRVVPIAGQTTGRVNLTFAGTNFRTASGTLTADFNANAGTSERGLVPVVGNLALRATNGLFDIESANLNTEKSKLNAAGRFDLEGSNSNLQIALDSSDASEIERIIKILDLSPALEDQLNSLQASFAGNLKFTGNLTGNLLNPTIEGRAALDSVSLRGRDLGSLAANISVSPDNIELRDGRLQQADGGNLAFNVNVPRTGENNISVQATLTKINTGSLLAALPFDLPETLRDFEGVTSGTVNLSGLPKQITGEANIRADNATVAGQSFDNFEAKLSFANSLVNIERFEGRSADGFLRATGTFDTNSTDFNFNVEGRNLQLARLKSLISKDPNFPAVAGMLDLTAKATGRFSDPTTFNINFNGAGQNIVISDKSLGTVSFVGNTVNRQLTANLTATLGGQAQTIAANVNFADPNLPFRAETNFNQTDLAPYIAFLSPPETVAVTGRATGRVFVEGNLYGAPDANDSRKFTTDNLRGEARFTEFSLLFNDTPYIATNPLFIRFDSNEVTVENATLTGSGSNLTVSGTKALSASAVNNLNVNGKINLHALDVISKNTFFTGLADLSVRLTGTNAESRLVGSAAVQNASLATFVGSENLALNRINGNLLFTSNQVQIENLTGYLGGGKVIASGGALLEGFTPKRFRFDLNGQNVTAPLAEGFLATGDAQIQISGESAGDAFNTLVAGNITARRALYTKDIDLADIIGNRREATLSEGTSSSSMFGVTRLNLTIEGRDALIVRNNIADLTASASLRVTGDIDEPVILGRVTANNGTVFFRNDRYEVQRGVLEFPPQNNGAPFINLQAESEIQGYQIVVNLLGDLSNPDQLSANVRSNPALPQADVISLITTGNLANTDTGIPTLAQSGINTAAEILTDSLINNPLRKATDRLFGLNRFELDPNISGQRLNPSARLTVGRQINRNLLITYSTNLSEDQSQVLALEYRVSNRLSFVAQYQQRSLSNVTRTNNNFSFEIRLRKRF